MEIIVRGWHTGQKKMYYPDEMAEDQLTLMPDGSGFINVHSVSTKLSQRVSEMIPLMFVGLNDIRDKAIYVGDIVKCGTDKDAPIAVIEFKQSAFLLNYDPLELDEKEKVYDYLEGYEYFEVLGNIYETPKLIPLSI